MDGQSGHLKREPFRHLDREGELDVANEAQQQVAYADLVLLNKVGTICSRGISVHECSQKNFSLSFCPLSNFPR